jgi:hypothetical protein
MAYQTEIEFSFTYPSKPELMLIIAKTEFNSFTEGDWFTFAGCETKNPLIGYYKDFTIVIDGSIINIIHAEDGHGGQLFSLYQS